MCKKIGNSLSILVLSLVIVVFIVGHFILGYTVMYVTSNSMQPFIQKGDYILCKRINLTEPLEVDGIYCYDSEGKLVIHRLKAITDVGLSFKGDNNISVDRMVQRENVEYTYVCVLFRLPFGKELD